MIFLDSLVLFLNNALTKFNILKCKTTKKNLNFFESQKMQNWTKNSIKNPQFQKKVILNPPKQMRKNAKLSKKIKNGKNYKNTGLFFFRSPKHAGKIQFSKSPEKKWINGKMQENDKSKNMKKMDFLSPPLLPHDARTIRRVAAVSRSVNN